MEVKTFVSDILDANCYLLTDGIKAIVIDPCVSYQRVFKNEKAVLAGVIITHGHIDHINELSSYLMKDNIKIYMHKRCEEKLADSHKNYSAFFEERLSYDIKDDQKCLVHDRSEIEVLNEKLMIIETPGHTDCSICVLTGNMMFSGDTLFRDTIGRTDLYTGNTCSMQLSIEKLRNLKLDYQVFPGHGEPTTLNYEKEHNRYFVRRLTISSQQKY
jgi:glyoxylase-like metal-dependent hydrolase (beta-lactamase superfamily II)